MAFGFFMNMEKLALTIAQKHIDQMTNSNIDENDPPFLLEDIFLRNLENGFVAITQMSCFIESFLNTIMNACMHCEDKTLLKCVVDQKIPLIFLYYNKDSKSIKSTHYWEAFRKTTRVRNEMIHFKKTYLGVSGELPDFPLAGERVSTFFTKSNMQKLLDSHVKLAKVIANELGLCIFEDVEIFHCDGMGSFVNYVYDENDPFDERHFRN